MKRAETPPLAGMACEPQQNEGELAAFADHLSLVQVVCSWFLFVVGAAEVGELRNNTVLQPSTKLALPSLVDVPCKG